MSTGEPVVPAGTAADSLNTTKLSVRSVVEVSPVGRAMLFQEGAVIVPRFAALTAVDESDVPIRSASRRPSRPTFTLPLVMLPVANVSGENGTVTEAPNCVADATLPLFKTVGVVPKAAVPVPPLPPIRGAPV